MTKENYKSLARKTKASNAKFAVLSRAEKRVAIAKDIVLAIRAKQLIPTHGTYFDADFDYERPTDNASLQELLPKIPACNVCAKGAILVCAVARQNEVTFGQAEEWRNYNGEKLSKALGGVFTPAQLDLIENAFEGKDDLTQSGTDETLTRIMKNIIKNKGTFKPVFKPNKSGGCGFDNCLSCGHYEF